MKVVTEKEAKECGARSKSSALRCSKRKWQAVVGFGFHRRWVEMLLAARCADNCACCHRHNIGIACSAEGSLRGECPLLGAGGCCNGLWSNWQEARDDGDCPRALLCARKILKFIESKIKPKGQKDG